MIHAVGYDEGGSFFAFGEEVACGAIQRARQTNGFFFFGQKREGAFDGANLIGVAALEAAAGFLFAHVADAVVAGGKEVDDPF